jgi:hypothetical protein
MVETLPTTHFEEPYTIPKLSEASNAEAWATDIYNLLKIDKPDQASFHPPEPSTHPTGTDSKTDFISTNPHRTDFISTNPHRTDSKTSSTYIPEKKSANASTATTTVRAFSLPEGNPPGYPYTPPKQHTTGGGHEVLDRPVLRTSFSDQQTTEPEQISPSRNDTSVQNTDRVEIEPEEELQGIPRSDKQIGTGELNVTDATEKTPLLVERTELAEGNVRLLYNKEFEERLLEEAKKAFPDVIPHILRESPEIEMLTGARHLDQVTEIYSNYLEARATWLQRLYRQLDLPDSLFKDEDMRVKSHILEREDATYDIMKKLSAGTLDEIIQTIDSQEFSHFKSERDNLRKLVQEIGKYTKGFENSLHEMFQHNHEDLMVSLNIRREVHELIEELLEVLSHFALLNIAQISKSIEQLMGKIQDWDKVPKATYPAKFAPAINSPSILAPEKLASLRTLKETDPDASLYTLAKTPKQLPGIGKSEMYARQIEHDKQKLQSLPPLAAQTQGEMKQIEKEKGALKEQIQTNTLMKIIADVYEAPQKLLSKSARSYSEKHQGTDILDKLQDFDANLDKRLTSLNRAVLHRAKELLNGPSPELEAELARLPADERSLLACSDDIQETIKKRDAVMKDEVKEPFWKNVETEQSDIAVRMRNGLKEYFIQEVRQIKKEAEKLKSQAAHVFRAGITVALVVSLASLIVASISLSNNINKNSTTPNKTQGNDPNGTHN